VNSQHAAMAMYICFVSNFIELQITNMQAKCIVAHQTKKVKWPQMVVSELKVLYNYVKTWH